MSTALFHDIHEKLQYMPSIEIPHDSPRQVIRRLRYLAHQHEYRWKFKVVEGGLRVAIILKSSRIKTWRHLSK